MGDDRIAPEHEVVLYLIGLNGPVATNLLVERAASHAGASRTGSALFHGDPDDRPGGPGAEADGVAAAGQPAPGPSAESPPTV
jgi:hypothetical protein